MNNKTTKILNKQTKYRTLCECGHSVLIPPGRDKIICSWCGKYVFKTTRSEFEYRLKECLKKLK